MKRNLLKYRDLVSVGYENGMLEVEFHDGSVRQYSGIPTEIYDALMKADSPRGYLRSHVTTKDYRCEKIEESDIVVIKKRKETEKVARKQKEATEEEQNRESRYNRLAQDYNRASTEREYSTLAQNFG